MTMRMCLIAIGTRMPAWVKAGFDEYAVRFPRECPLQLLEIPAGKRGKQGGLERLVREEGERILAAVPKGARLIARPSILSITAICGLPWKSWKILRLPRCVLFPAGCRPTGGGHRLPHRNG